MIITTILAWCLADLTDNPDILAPIRNTQIKAEGFAFQLIITFQRRVGRGTCKALKARVPRMRIESTDLND